MGSAAEPDFGTCPCGGRYQTRWVDIQLRIGGEGVILERVAQGACQTCLSRVYKADVLERIEAVMRSGR